MTLLGYGSFWKGSWVVSRIVLHFVFVFFTGARLIYSFVRNYHLFEGQNQTRLSVNTLVPFYLFLGKSWKEAVYKDMHSLLIVL